MSNPRQVISQWTSFSDTELADHVRHLVRNHGPQTSQVWAQVRTNAVLAGRVRGTLSVLRAQTRDSRDAAMWTAWISKAQQELAAQPEPTPAPVVEAEQAPLEFSVPEPPAAQSARPTTAVPPVEISLHEPVHQPKPTSAAPVVMFQAPGQ